MGRGQQGGGQVSIGDPLALCSSHRSLLTTVHWPRDGPSSQQTPLVLCLEFPTVGPQTCPPQAPLKGHLPALLITADTLSPLFQDMNVMSHEGRDSETENQPELVERQWAHRAPRSPHLPVLCT